MLKKLSLKDRIIILIALVVNITLVVLGTIRTDYSLTAKGGLTSARSIIRINDASPSSGSYNTIYVISFNKTTLVQNWMAQLFSTVTLEKLSASYSQFSDYENYLMGQIQHNSSVMQSVISAYNKARTLQQDISISYTLSSLAVSFYEEKKDFNIGDEITKIDGVNINELDLNLTNGCGWLDLKAGQKINYLRNQETREIILKEDTNLYCYPYFTIDENNLKPSLTINKGYTGGPSGGLLRSLSLVDDLLNIDLTHGLNIAGTGTISITGNVGAIGGIKQKIYTAYSNDVDVFFCPSSNYEEAYSVYKTLDTDMKLYEVSSLDEALEVLFNYED